MSTDFWASRLAAAKRQLYTLPHHHNGSQLDRLSIDDFDVEDEARPDVPCPYCYEEYDIASLCSHLEDEHSSESRVTIGRWHMEILHGQMLLRQCSQWHKKRVCSICSVKVARDMLNHITMQHGHLFKRRRRLRRVAIPSSQALSLLGRDLREAHLQVLLGGGEYRSSIANASNAVADQFLSSLVWNISATEAEEISNSLSSSSEDTCSKKAALAHAWKSSFDPSLSYEERERRMRQGAGRAGFVQDLLLSTLLAD